MKYAQPEKMEIIRMVEEPSLRVKRTLREMDVPHSSFCEWRRRYGDEGYDGLASRHKDLRQERETEHARGDPDLRPLDPMRGRRTIPISGCPFPLSVLLPIA